MKANLLGGVIGSLLLVSVFSGAAFSMTTYDTFSGPMINPTKWDTQEWVREIRNIGGYYELFSRVSASGTSNSNHLYVNSPGGIYYLEAMVALTSATAPFDATQATLSHAGLIGVFYNDGTVGTESLGDVAGQVRLELSRGQLKAKYYVLRYTSPDRSTWDTLDSGTIPGTINLNTAYKLAIKFDPNISPKKFTFTAGVNTAAWPPDNRISTANAPRYDWKMLRTYVEAPSGYLGSVSATFDSFKAQNASGGVVFSDEFPGPDINTTYWGPNLEFVREIENGRLRLKYKGIGLSGAGVGNYLPFSHPEMINEIQARVSLTDFQKSVPETNVQARIGGYFFNTTGSPYNNSLNQVYAAIALGGSVASPRVFWYVNRMTTADGTGSELLAPDSVGTLVASFTAPATYTLSLKWDGEKFTFTCTDSGGTTLPPIIYTPVTGIHPSNIHYKEMAVKIWPPASQTIDATIDATFDDVLTDIRNLFLPLILKN